MTSRPAASNDENHKTAALLHDHDDVEKMRSSLIETQSNIADRQFRLTALNSEIDTKKEKLMSRCFIDRLVDEPLFQVFFHLTQDFDMCYPWIFVAVCKRWKRICLDNPALWSYFDLMPGHRCGRSHLHDTKLLMRTVLQLERSKAALLSVCTGVDFCCCKHQLSRWQVLVDQIPRWERITFLFGIANDSEVGQVFDLIPKNTKFPVLRHIWWERVFHDISILPLFNEGVLPALKSIRLGYNTSMKGIDQLPFRQLTSLFIRTFSPNSQELLSVLSSCHALQHLRLHIIGMQPSELDPPAATTTTNVILPNLVSLDLENNRGDIISGQLLPYLHFPSLRRLKVSTSGMIQAILNSVRRSSCGDRLTDLALHYNPSAGEEVLSLLQLCPNIHSLSLTACEVGDTITNLVLHPTDSAARNICPNMRKLHLAVLGFDPATMIQMVDSRTCDNCEAPSKRLESLLINYLPRTENKTTQDAERAYCTALLQDKFKIEQSTLILKISMYEREPD